MTDRRQYDGMLRIDRRAPLCAPLPSSGVSISTVLVQHAEQPLCDQQSIQRQLIHDRHHTHTLSTVLLSSWVQYVELSHLGEKIGSLKSCECAQCGVTPQPVLCLVIARDHDERTFFRIFSLNLLVFGRYFSKIVPQNSY